MIAQRFDRGIFVPIVEDRTVIATKKDQRVAVKLVRFQRT
jgi:hypothetical protein